MDGWDVWMDGMYGWDGTGGWMDRLYHLNITPTGAVMASHSK